MEGDGKNLSATGSGLNEYTEHSTNATYGRRNLTCCRQYKASNLNLTNFTVSRKK